MTYRKTSSTRSIFPTHRNSIAKNRTKTHTVRQMDRQSHLSNNVHNRKMLIKLWLHVIRGIRKITANNSLRIRNIYTYVFKIITFNKKKYKITNHIIKLQSTHIYTSCFFFLAIWHAWPQTSL